MSGWRAARETFRPVRSIELALRARGDDGEFSTLPVLGGLGMSSEGLGELRREVKHHDMPLRLSTIDLGQAAQRLMQLKDHYARDAVKIAERLGSITDVSAQADSKLHAAAIARNLLKACAAASTDARRSIRSNS